MSEEQAPIEYAAIQDPNTIERFARPGTGGPNGLSKNLEKTVMANSPTPRPQTPPVETRPNQPAETRPQPPVETR